MKDDNIFLECITEGDTEFIVKNRNDERVSRWLDSYLPLSREQHLNWLKGLEGDLSRLYMKITKPISSGGDSLSVYTSYTVFAGVVWLKNINYQTRCAEIGIWVVPAYHGKGIGGRAVDIMCEYAFSTLNLNKIWGTVFSGNLRSANMFKSNGFELEGVLKQEAYRNRKYIDIERYGRLKNSVPVVRSSVPSTTDEEANDMAPIGNLTDVYGGR